MHQETHQKMHWEMHSIRPEYRVGISGYLGSLAFIGGFRAPAAGAAKG
jgi:hypothetical protein